MNTAPIPDATLARCIEVLRRELGLTEPTRTFAEIFAAYRLVELQQCKVSWRRRRARHLELLEQHCQGRRLGEARELGRTLLAAYADRPGYARVLWSVFARLVRIACEMSWLPRWPLAGIRPPRARRRTRVLTLQERVALDRELTDGPVRMLKWVPLRIGECVGLQWEWIDLEAEVIRLPDSKVGPRVVPIPQQVVTMLQRAGPRQNGSVWGVSESTVRRELLYACRRAGVRPFPPHTLRHTWATVAAESGAPQSWIRDVGGWSDAYVAATYQHTTYPEQLPLFATRIVEVIRGGKS
jgi:integrase